MKKNNLNTKIHKQKGISLIEILISLLVLGVGLLGIAGLQMTGLKYSSGALARTQASLLANDMMDRMRANRNQAISSTIYNLDFRSSFTANRDCSIQNCDAQERAQHDKQKWLEQVSNLLPSGAGRITSNDVGSDRVYEITLQWRQLVNEEQGDDPNDEIRTFTFRSVL